MYLPNSIRCVAQLVINILRWFRNAQMSDNTMENGNDAGMNVGDGDQVENTAEANDDDVGMNSRDEERSEDEIIVDTGIAENVKGFRHNSLALVTYPWASGVIMQPNLSKIFDQNHYAFVS
jgi:hypothetical protein